MPNGIEDLQHDVARVLLAAIGEAGFVLAGAGAIRAHGLTDRPTHDVDLFTEPLISEVDFRRACVDGRRALLLAGYEVKIHRQTGVFTRMSVHDDRGRTMDVDLAMNWRADVPVQMRVGPVLSESDAVAGKISAVYSRGEVRDFLDLDAIRSSGRYTDSDLLALGRKHDAGFEVDVFAAQLSRVMRFDALEADEYGVTPRQFDGVQQRIQTWAGSLRE